MKRLFVPFLTMAILLSFCACTGAYETDQPTTTALDPRTTDTKEEILSESETQGDSADDEGQSLVTTTPTTTTTAIPTSNRPNPTTSAHATTTKKPHTTTTKKPRPTTTKKPTTTTKTRVTSTKAPTTTTKAPTTTTKAPVTTTKKPSSNLTPELQEKLEKAKTCKFCGRKKGYGNNGTCVRFSCEMDCPRCGVHVRALTCHTCG